MMVSARTPRRNGPYAPLSAFYAEDDAVIALEQAGNDLAELLFLRALAYCAREPKLNGAISRLKLTRIFNRPLTRLVKAAQALVEVGLWEPHDDGWRIRQWNKWNRSEDEIARRQEADRARKSHGFRADSVRNPELSAHQGSSTAVQDSSGQGSGTDLPAAAAQLRDELTRAGIRVAWKLNVVDTASVLEAIDRCGVSALVRQAKAQYRPDDPAHSVKAFMGGWESLPARPGPLELVADPCEHGEAHASRCALCRVAS